MILAKNNDETMGWRSFCKLLIACGRYGSAIGLCMGTVRCTYLAISIPNAILQL